MPECEPPQAVDVPPRFRVLFEKGRRLVYAMGDEVDTHSTTDPHESNKVKITCVVRALRKFRGAAASELACVPARYEAYIAPSETVAYVANERALWVSFTLPADEEAVKQIMATPPFLSANPVKTSRRRQQPGMFEGQKDQCVDAVEVTGPLACHDTRCRIVQGYGDTIDRWCCFQGSFVTLCSRFGATGAGAVLTIARRRIDPGSVGERGTVVQNGKSSS